MPTHLLLKEWGKRQGLGEAGAVDEQKRVDLQARLDAIAARLRIDADHPKQHAFTHDACDQVAAVCTRRSGKSRGGLREYYAYACAVPGSRQVYINETREECIKIAWEGKDGLLKIEKEFKAGAVPNHTRLILRFPNGSVIELFGGDDRKQLDKQRGTPANRYWVDEAQKLPYLQMFVEDVLQANCTDYGGSIWITGTPSEDCVGYFYDVSREDADALPGWSVHRFSVVDNPFFGATPDERWERTAGAILRKNRWTGEEPKFQREWLGKWVRTDARYVYAVHAAPRLGLTFAPVRTRPREVLGRADSFYDHHAAVADLPLRANGKAHEWFFALGADLGFHPDPFALAIWAFSPTSRDIYELWSWKRTNLVPDDQKLILEMLQADVPFSVMVSDWAGATGLLAGWQERGLPVEGADKSGKRTWQEMLNGDIRSGRVHFRVGSALLYEMENLVWRPQTSGNAPPKEWADRVLPNGTVPGGHCADGALYSYRHLTHYLNPAEEKPPAPGDPEYERALNARVEDEFDEQQDAEAEDGDDYFYQ
jgi:hypothetical protein